MKRTIILGELNIELDTLENAVQEDVLLLKIDTEGHEVCPLFLSLLLSLSVSLFLLSSPSLFLADVSWCRTRCSVGCRVCCGGTQCRILCARRSVTMTFATNATL